MRLASTGTDRDDITITTWTATVETVTLTNSFFCIMIAEVSVGNLDAMIFGQFTVTDFTLRHQFNWSYAEGRIRVSVLKAGPLQSATRIRGDAHALRPRTHRSDVECDTVSVGIPLCIGRTLWNFGLLDHYVGQ